MSTTLAYIVLANLLSTLVSIGLAAVLSFRYLSGLVDKLVCVSAGLMLTVAFTHLLPEAFHSEADPFFLGWVLLASILGFFLLEKLSLIHHTHHHEGDTHHHHHGHDAQEAGRGGMLILIGAALGIPVTPRRVADRPMYPDEPGRGARDVQAAHARRPVRRAVLRRLRAHALLVAASGRFRTIVSVPSDSGERYTPAGMWRRAA